MTLSLQESRYPLSSADGKYIPLAVLGPVNIINQAITTSALGATIPLANIDDYILEIKSDVDCIIGFDAIPVNGTTTPGEYILLANEVRYILPLSITFSAVALTAAGNIYVNVLRKWNTLAITLDEG